MFKDEQYSRIVEAFKEAKKDLDKMKNAGMYDKHYLMTKGQETQHAVMADLNNFYNDKIHTLRQKQEEIKQKYSVKTYEDPTAELLKRQDIERKYKLMNDEDLKQQVREMKQKAHSGKEVEGDSFQFDTIQLELRNRGFDTEFSEIGAVRNALDIDSPWNKDEEFVKAAKEMMLVNQTRGTKLLWEGEGEDRIVHSIDNL